MRLLETMRDFVALKVEQTDRSSIVATEYQVRLSVADNFRYRMLLLWIQTHSFGKGLFNLIKEGKRSFVVADDKLVLLGFKPGAAGRNLFFNYVIRR